MRLEMHQSERKAEWALCFKHQSASYSDVHTRSVRRKELLSMPQNVSAVYRNFEVLYNSKNIQIFLSNKYKDKLELLIKYYKNTIQ